MSNHHIVIVVGLAILNGLFSPALILVFALQGIWYPFFLPPMLPVVFMASSLIVSTFTLMIGGVPAAIYERLTGASASTFVSGLIWLAGVVLLTLPAMPGILAALGLGAG
ncbi:MAG: hypothetical protein HC855_07365 [Rhizobiales bacterium]|nr:hypothetical protein [Hyphomicrobiales bacterium]